MVSVKQFFTFNQLYTVTLPLSLKEIMIKKCLYPFYCYLNVQAWSDLEFGGLFMCSFIIRWHTE